MEKQSYLDDCRKHNIPYFEHECPKCGWNVLSEKGIDNGYCEIINGRETHTDFGPGFDMQIKCCCPICETEFEYFDGSP